MMGARSAERVMPPISHAASDALWNRACSAADASTSGRSHRVDDDENVVVLLSEETAASEAAPLVPHNAVKLAFCGGISGALAKTCTAPLARLTILYQVQAFTHTGPGVAARQLGVVAALRHVVATEGVLSLWKGNLVTILHRIPYSATNFFTYEATKKALEGRLANDVARAWAAGAISGLVACTAAYPLDLLRTRIAAETAVHGQPQHYRHIPSALGRIVSEQGVRGLYKGLGATLVQVVPGLAFNFCFYDTFKRVAMKQQQLYQLYRQQQQLLVMEVPLSHREQQQQRGHLQLPQQLGLERLAALVGMGSVSSNMTNILSGYSSSLSGTGSSSLSSSGSSCNSSGRAFADDSKCEGGRCRGGSGSQAGCGTQAESQASTQPTALTSALCACAAGLCTSTLTFPLDVVRRRLQVYERGPLGRLRYQDVVRAVYAEGGVAAFYRGMGPEYAKVLPGMAIAFSAYEGLKRLTGAAT
ncbi:hypothetical protein Agub_g9792 [Astrephomene gubernaculifera]|uniref:Mitochondrial carrier protein n=1 Tax=Astrephomene gubernaculifera TaxID=47775 RepID=A0AAD3DU96_9CHLO|nr:hypothetical protein Agub_g9792 [Astrephomene gubernaculifera]